MPHYFFHFFREGKPLVRDEEGLSFENDHVARHEGLQGLVDVLKETALYRVMPLQLSVQIIRQDHAVVDFVTARLSRE